MSNSESNDFLEMLLRKQIEGVEAVIGGRLTEQHILDRLNQLRQTAAATDHDVLPPDEWDALPINDAWDDVAWEEAGRIVAAARREEQKIVADAKLQARRILESAHRHRAEAERALTEARRERREAERLLDRAHATAADLQRKADQRIAAARREAEDLLASAAAAPVRPGRGEEVAPAVSELAEVAAGGGDRPGLARREEDEER